MPSKNEWQELINYLGDSNVAGGKMKESGTKHWNAPNTGATNESGFSALTCYWNLVSDVPTTAFGDLGF